MILLFYRFNTVLSALILFVAGANSVTFKVPESAPPEHIIGYVEGRPQTNTEAKYFVVFTDTAGENAIKVDDRTGEITVASPLDFEKQKRYEVVAIPIGGGDGIPLTIEVEDENDNIPVFSQDAIRLEISEFARLGAEFPLPSAVDGDSPPFDVRLYRISTGNVNNVFKLSTKRINNVLYADLVVNGKLDREYRESYELVVEAVDGGNPPNVGELQVSVLILDANDNAPIFNEKAYHLSIEPNVSSDVTLLQLKAVDRDSGANGHVVYRMAETHSSSSRLFRVSPTGELSHSSSVLLPLGNYEIAVIASDQGVPPQETSTLVTISVESLFPSSPSLDILWLTENTECRLLENATLGSIVARVNITNNELAKGQLELTGCPSLCLHQSQSESVYLVILCGLFDREATPEYHLKFSLRKGKDVVLEHPVVLSIDDVNDNAPRWSTTNLHITLNRTISNPEDPNLNLAASDADAGVNGRIQYSIVNSDVIGIDEDTGRLRYLKELDCSLGSELKFEVKAKDGGTPSLSSSLQVSADIVESAGQPPTFERALYTERIREDADVGTCILKVLAQNSNCGGSSRIRYSLRDPPKGEKTFTVDSQSGTICLEKPIDYEKKRRYQLTIEAHDHAGNSASSLVNIEVIDVNDNVPIFYPIQYNITVREGDKEKGLLVVQAEDKDSGEIGEIRYKIVSGNVRLFRINSTSGEIFSSGHLPKGIFTLGIGANDGEGHSSKQPATVHITVISDLAPAPLFTQSSYLINTSEDILPGISIGSVEAIAAGPIRYSIYSGDPDHQFTISPETGRITVARYLDADKHDTILLNVKADMVGGGSNHTQVVIHIEDHNDNAPEFSSDTLELTVREDAKPHEPIYVVQATDKDKKRNGQISYSLISSFPSAPLMVQPITGQIVLIGPLDYETVKEYKIRIKAQDHGVPPRSANVTVIVRVSDVNDNAPVFEKNLYKTEVVEHSPSMTKLVQVRATDADSAQNAMIDYRLADDVTEFGIDSKNGEIFVKKDVDREIKSEYKLTIYAQDNGMPSKSSSTIVRVTVLDINDNSPSCPTIDTITVPADADTRLPFGSIIATDPDQGENGTIIYRSQQNNPLFIVKGNGDVLLRKPLPDPIDKSLMRVSVVASDGGSPKRSTVCHVNIRKVEGTSSLRLEKPLETNIRIPANCEGGCLLTRINATNVANWNVLSNDISSHFSVSTTGILSLLSVPPLYSSHSLTVVMSDDVGRQKHVTLKILPYRDIKGDRQIVRVSGTLPIGSRLAEITDRHAEGIFYRLMNETSIVEVDESSGVLYLTGRLKRHVGEVVDLHLKQISIDSLSDSSDKWVTLEVEGGAPERPRFPKNLYRANISENTTPGSIVFSASASLPSPLSLLTYRIIDGEEHFTIDGSRGEISLSKEIDWSETPELVAVVEVESDGVTSSTVVVFTVIDMNNHSPRILSPSKVILVDQFSSGPFHYFVAEDLDKGDNGRITYEIIGGDGRNFEIDKESGGLRILHHIDSEQSITVRAKDSGNPPLFQDQKLTIKLHESVPIWRYFRRPIYEVEVEKDAVEGTAVMEFPGTGDLSFSLFPHSAPFSIDLYSGSVKISGKIKDDDLRILVHVEDVSNNSDHTVLHIKTKNYPAANLLKISSSSCSNTTVPENEAVLNLKEIVAVGTSANTTYQIQAGNDHSAFHMNSSTGEISCKPLDREEKSEYLLVVTVQDGRRSDTCTVRVSVADVNDNSPRFDGDTPQTLTLTDESKVGETLHRFSASDPDEGDNGDVRFLLLDDESGLIDIDTKTGRMYYAREMPVQSKEWMIRVRASDNGRTNIQKTDRFVRMRDHRTHYADPSETPQFLRHKYVGIVSEGMERGQEVIQISSSSSRDSHITYSIVEGNIDSAFQIDSQGRISTAQELDYEIRGEYELKVIGTGNFHGHMDTVVDVKVLNVNDNPPAFPPTKRRKIVENSPIGTFVSTVTANDVDGDSLLEYSIESETVEDEKNGKEFRRFTIEKYTGAVHLKEKLDYEREQEVTVRIKAFDGVHSAFTELTVEVIDENDNSPEFAQSFFDVVLPEGIKAGDTVTQMSAVDRDHGENGRLIYQIDEPNPFFKVDSTNGEISALVAPPPSSSHMFSLRASDCGIPSRSSVTVIRIRVSNGHETRQPKFDKPFYSFIVSERTLPHIAVGNVSVSEHSSSLVPLFFRILDSEVSKVFDIDRFGRLFLERRVDRELREEYKFHIDVSSGWNPLSVNSTATVSIRISDENDNYPRFTNEINRVVVHDQLKRGQVLQRLSVSDVDLNENGRIAYRITSGNDYGILSLEADTGALVFNEWNDEQLSAMENVTSKYGSRWMVTVIARDGGFPSRFTVLEIPVEVDLSKWSSSAPFFVLPSYVRHIPESSAPLTGILRTRAVNRIGLDDTALHYSLKDNDEIFSIDPSTGVVSSSEALDFERHQTFAFSVHATDGRGRSAVAPVQIVVLPVDEFAPIFTRNKYTFQIPLSAEIGSDVGIVSASDADSGRDGKVRYKLAREHAKRGEAEDQESLVEIDGESGVIRLLKEISPNRNLTLEKVVVTAESGPTQHTQTTVYLEIGEFPSSSKSPQLSHSLLTVAAVCTLLLFLLLLCVLIGCVYRFKTQTKEIDNPRKQVYSVSKGQVAAVVTEMNRNSPKFAPILSSSKGNKPSSVTSSASVHSNLRHSDISRDFISTRSHPDSGIDPDAISLSSSVTEYLSSLGVNTAPPPPRPRQRRTDPRESELNEFIYARVDDIMGPGPINVSRTMDSFQSITPITLPPIRRESPPTFQPMTEIFSEIGRLQMEKRSQRRDNGLRIDI